MNAPTAGTALLAETQELTDAETPKVLEFEWPPRGVKMSSEKMPPPPPAMRKFVRSLSLLGIPIREICRRVGERVGEAYHAQYLYRDFRSDLVARAPRRAAMQKKVRLIKKPEGWKPITKGSPFSFADVLAILQSDLDSKDLAKLYGTSEKLIVSMRKGEARYMRKFFPRLMAMKVSVTPEEMRQRGRVVSDLARKTVSQMAVMIDNFLTMIETGAMRNPLEIGITEDSTVLYKKEGDAIARRIVNSQLEKRAALVEGWTEEVPQ